jgi:hypothetical protein
VVEERHALDAGAMLAVHSQHVVDEERVQIEELPA